MKPLTIQVPEDLLLLGGWTESEAQAAATRSLVMELVRQGRISTGKAAELLCVSRWDIDAILADYRIDSVDWDSQISI